MTRRFRQARSLTRPWVATAAAFALALQVLLGGILATRAEAAGMSPDSPFEICLGSGDAAPADHGTGKAPVKHSQCVLCTLAKLSPAIVPANEAATLTLGQLTAVVFAPTAHIAQFHSPTGHYQRGPPASVLG